MTVICIVSTLHFSHKQQQQQQQHFAGNQFRLFIQLLSDHAWLKKHKKKITQTYRYQG